MLKGTEIEETIFFVTFLSVVTFQMGGGVGDGPPGPPLATPMCLTQTKIAIIDLIQLSINRIHHQQPTFQHFNKSAVSNSYGQNPVGNFAHN